MSFWKKIFSQKNEGSQGFGAETSIGDSLPDAYLGTLDHPEHLAVEKFHDIFRPLSLPVWGSFSDGAAQQA